MNDSIPVNQINLQTPSRATHLDVSPPRRLDMSPTTPLDAFASSLGVDADAVPLYVARTLVAVVVAYFLAARLLSRADAGRGDDRAKTTKPDPTTPYTTAEIATHASLNDLWVIIDDKVYDLTDYVDEHPGGTDAIAKNAGKDATVGFKGPQHPSRVFDIVEEYRVGVVATP